MWKLRVSFRQIVHWLMFLWGRCNRVPAVRSKDAAIHERFENEWPSSGFRACAYRTLTVGEIGEHILGIRGASKDPDLAYWNDPFWRQYQRLTRQIPVKPENRDDDVNSNPADERI